VTTLEQVVPGQTLPEAWLFVPRDPLPGTTRAGEPLPLVIFVHGSGAVDAAAYLAWIEHLVRRGAVVLFPLYQNTTLGEGGYRQTLQDDVRGGLESLERERVPVDLSRVAVVGHSLGEPAGTGLDGCAPRSAVCATRLDPEDRSGEVPLPRSPAEAVRRVWVA
jgi:acetyl esterase/lipase